MRERTILFVDDEEKSRKYFRMIYRRTFKILIAADGSEALQLFTENRKEIGVVVTDQIMPHMTGLDLLGEVESIEPEVIRILSTAYADSELVAEAAQNSLIDYFIVKPWDIERVSATLEQAVAHFEHNRGAGAV
ncbi:MAG: response regulator [Akkermansiaceae bacterium]